MKLEDVEFPGFSERTRDFKRVSVGASVDWYHWSLPLGVHVGPVVQFGHRFMAAGFSIGPFSVAVMW